MTKEEAKAKLRKSGYTVTDDNSVVTVYIAPEDNMKNVIRDIKEKLYTWGYNASFSVKQHKGTVELDVKKTEATDESDMAELDEDLSLNEDLSSDDARYSDEDLSSDEDLAAVTEENEAVEPGIDSNTKEDKMASKPKSAKPKNAKPKKTEPPKAEPPKAEPKKDDTSDSDDDDDEWYDEEDSDMLLTEESIQFSLEDFGLDF